MRTTHPAWRCLLVLVAGAMILGWAATAHADQTPLGCSQNNLSLDVGRDAAVVRSGDTIVYSVTVANVDSVQGPACDLTGATVTLTLPAADGTPTGPTITLASSIDLPANGPPQTFVAPPHSLALDPGVADAVARAEATGSLHDAPRDHEAAVSKTLGTQVAEPKMTVTVAPSTTEGRVPFDVVYTYTLRNESPSGDPISNVTVADEGCSAVIFTGGDANGDAILDTNEMWTYTCTRTITTPGAATTRVTGSGNDTVDSRPVAAEEAVVTVSASSPSATVTTSCPDGGAIVRMSNPGATAPSTFGVSRNGEPPETVTVAPGEEVAKGYPLSSGESATFQVTGPSDYDSGPQQVTNDCAARSGAGTGSGEAPQTPQSPASNPAPEVLAVTTETSTLPRTGPGLPLAAIAMGGLGLIALGAGLLKRSLGPALSTAALGLTTPATKPAVRYAPCGTLRPTRWRSAPARRQ